MDYHLLSQSEPLVCRSSENRMNLRPFILMASLSLSAQAMALDPAACSAAAQQIDERIAAGSHSPQNVSIAEQIRDGIVQTCSFLDDETLAQMMQGLDQLLPGGDSGRNTPPQQSAAERQAEREAARAEVDRRQAERAKRREERRARQAAEQELVSDVVQRPPTALLKKGLRINRPDAMWGASMVDWDFFEDRARLLYETRPSLEQGQDQNAKRHYYVVEVDRDDNVVQHGVFTSPLARTVTAGLLRGRDEIIVQWHEGGDGAQASTLERWSISDTKLLSQSTAPRLQGPRGLLGPQNHFVLVTESGDLLYTRTVALESGPHSRSGVSWALASPDGEMRDQGLIEHSNEKVGAGDWFHGANGGAGLLLDIASEGESGISSELKPGVERFGSTNVTPVVGSERRLYLAGGEETGPQLPAIERRLMWLGLENVEQSVMVSGESTRLMQDATRRYRVDDTAVSLSVAGRHRTAVAPTGTGHAVLVRNNASDDAFPSTKGLWLQEFASGNLNRETHLEPDARHLKSQFTMLDSDGGERLYVASTRHVLLLDADRKVAAYAETSAADAQVKAIVADGDSVWLFGEHNVNAAQQQMWAGRIQF